MAPLAEAAAAQEASVVVLSPEDHGTTLLQDVDLGTLQEALPVGLCDVVFDAGHDEMIMVRDIPLQSFCEHHLIPFAGKAHVAYIPNTAQQITGLSKIARVVDLLSKKPQVQERLTTEIAEAIDRALTPRGVFVVIEAEHLCMTMRGIKKPGAVTVTSTVRGLFRSDARTRQEAMDHIGMR